MFCSNRIGVFMNSIKFSLSLLFLLIFSCKNVSSIKHKIATDTLQQSQKIFDTTKWEANTVDTFNYSNLPYWNENMDRFDSAYVDTFTVGGCKFRLVNPFANKLEPDDIVVYLEKLINDRWVLTNLSFTKELYGEDINHNTDINEDGFIDITRSNRFTMGVYFFNPKTKTFIDTLLDGNYINTQRIMIDSSRKVFSDLQEGKGMCGQIHSTLYTFKGFQKYYLYDLELYNCSNDPDTITKLILSKYINGLYDSTKRITETDLVKPIVASDSGYFDYKKFWKERYKKLLGYQ